MTLPRHILNESHTYIIHSMFGCCPPIPLALDVRVGMGNQQQQLRVEQTKLFPGPHLRTHHQHPSTSSSKSLHHEAATLQLHSPIHFNSPDNRTQKGTPAAKTSAKPKASRNGFPRVRGTVPAHGGARGWESHLGTQKMCHFGT